MLFRRLILVLLCTAACGALLSSARGQDRASQTPAAGEETSPKLNLKDFGLPGLGATGDGDVTFTATYRVLRGSAQGTLSIKAEITPGWHIYSLTQAERDGALPSQLVVRSDDVVSPQQLEFEASPPAQKVKEEGYSVPFEEHKDEVIWTAPFFLKKGANPENARIEITFTGSVCQKVCIPIFNRKVPAKFTGFIEPASTPGEYRPHRNNLLWKGRLEPKVVAPGGKAKLIFEVIPDKGYHFYPIAYRIPEKAESIPTLIIVTGPGTWRRHGVLASAAPKVVRNENGKQTYYDEPTTFSVELDVPKEAKPGPLFVTGVIGYQTCTEERCNQPGGAQFTVPITVGEATEAGTVPVNFSEVASFKTQVMDLANTTPLPYGVIDYPILVAQLGLSLLGGLLLNLMPCVLPVLGLKILAFAQQGGKSRSKVLALNIVYTLGLVAVFVVLATLAAFLNFGWGQQFTQMWFKVTLLVMTFAFALSFLGVWEIPIPGFASSGQAEALQRQEGFLGAFFKGVFTTVLGVSCSGPFLGGVFGYTLTQPPLVTYLIFVCVAVGMAAPFLIIALVPQLQRMIPKPGEWMNTFKHVMGFVMLGVVVYLFSTLGKDYYIATLAMLVGVGFGCWWVGRVPAYEETSKQVWAWIGGAAAAVLIGFLSFQYLGPVKRLYTWKEFSPAELAILQKDNKTVMIDFTASWCLNCQTNFRWAINTQAVKQAVEKNGVVALEADWTEPNPELEAKLAELNSASIPVLAIYPAGRPQDVIILRDIVTAKQVVEALEKAGPSKDVAAKAKKSVPAASTAKAAAGKPRAG